MPENKIDLSNYSVYTCRSCHQTLKRFHAGKYPNNKDTRWVDENGRQCSGKLCPQCNADRAAQYKRLKRTLNNG